jgi:acyl dehydratase
VRDDLALGANLSFPATNGKANGRLPPEGWASERRRPRRRRGPGDVGVRFRGELASPRLIGKAVLTQKAAAGDRGASEAILDLLHFEDFPVGEIFAFGDTLVTAEDIVEFAREWDPQPFHIDAEAAKTSQIGELIASGWHTGSLTMRMLCDGYLLRSASEGAPGVEEMRWLKPVRPGDRLSVRRTTLAARPSRSRPGIGIVEFQFEVLNQHGETAMTLKSASFLRRRPEAPV